MRVPYVDFAHDYREIELELGEAVARVLRKGRYILSEEVEAFEAEFAHYVGAKHCVGVGNGTEAIKLALVALDVGPGDAVVVPANTCSPTWVGVSASGASLAPVDPDERTYNVSPETIEHVITERTRAIVPVHLYGQPADIAEIEALARRRGLKLVQDCAPAHGALSRGKPLGGFGDAAAWSFYPTKNLGAYGDAGAVTTNDANVAERVRALRNYGTSVVLTAGVTGSNSRLDEIQAAMLRVKLRHLPEWNARRRQIASLYLDGLEQASLRLPHVPDHAEPVWHMFVARTPDRDAVKNHLDFHGVETLVRYADLPYFEPAFHRENFAPHGFPVSERLRREVLSLPIGMHLRDAQVERVIELLNAWPTHAGNNEP